jgi:hypothetical protein
MTDIISTLVSRAPRYQIKNDRDLSVTIEREDASDPIEATLVNFSVSGAKFKVSQAISAREVLAVTIQAKRRNRTIVVSGEVCWVRPTAGDDWWLGCSLDPQIPEDLLCELSEDGTIDRREHEREEVTLRTTAQWELNDETASAWILNYSRGGFCLLSRFTGKPGERVRLQLELDDDQVILVPAKTQWVAKSQEGFVIGCEFLEPADYTVICELAASRPPDKGTFLVGRRHWLRRWFGKDGSGDGPTNRQSLLRRSCTIAGGTAVLCLAIYLVFLSLATKTQHSVDQRDSLPGSLAASSVGIEVDNANASHVLQDANQAVRPAATSGFRSSDAVDPVERMRPAASVALKDNEQAAGTPHRAPGDGDVAESRTRARRAPAGSSTSPIRSPYAPTPITRSEAYPDTSPRTSRQLASNSPPVRTTVNVQTLWNEINSKPVEVPFTAASDIAEVSVIGGPPGENDERQESSSPSYRTWVDRTGRFRVVARFVNLEGNLVRLRTEDGKYKVIPLERLSRDDVRYVRHRLSEWNHATAPQ